MLQQPAALLLRHIQKDFLFHSFHCKFICLKHLMELNGDMCTVSTSFHHNKLQNHL